MPRILRARQVDNQAPTATLLEPGGALALEVDARRAALVAELVLGDGRYADVAVRLDLTGRERFVTARRADDAR